MEGKTGNLGDSIKVVKKETNVLVTTSIPMSKRCVCVCVCARAHMQVYVLCVCECSILNAMFCCINPGLCSLLAKVLEVLNKEVPEEE